MKYPLGQNISINFTQKLNMRKEPDNTGWKPNTVNTEVPWVFLYTWQQVGLGLLSLFASETITCSFLLSYYYTLKFLEQGIRPRDLSQISAWTDLIPLYRWSQCVLPLVSVSTSHTVQNFHFHVCEGLSYWSGMSRNYTWSSLWLNHKNKNHNCLCKSL